MPKPTLNEADEAIRHHSSPSFNSVLTLQFSRNFDYNNNAEILRASISVSNPKSLEKFQNPFPEIQKPSISHRFCCSKLTNPKSMLLVVVSAVYTNAGFPPLLLEISSAGYGGFDFFRVFLRASVLSSLRFCGGRLSNWPERLTTIPPRISGGSLKAITAEMFNENTELWKKRVAYYKTLDYQLAEPGRFRNLLDMN
ncbi:S-adenosyl-L-methionine-dependent methyltransferase superfamily protein [Trifolium repens]|nr:S-adenosyl-L-methionine-dependent methyltransferase superfamily protein [Trifolium repens]